MTLPATLPRLALVAHGNPASQARYRRALIPRRFIVEPALTGPDALAKALASPPDVMVIEVNLPLIDGYALCELLRRDDDTRHVPLVLITPAQTADPEGRQMGASIVVPETVSDDALAESIAKLVDPDGNPRPMAVAPQPRVAGAEARLQPPLLRCRRCDRTLIHERSYPGGVGRRSEQWDIFICPEGCGRWEYRHRTRSVRAVADSRSNFSQTAPP